MNRRRCHVGRRCRWARWRAAISRAAARNPSTTASRHATTEPYGLIEAMIERA